MLHAIWRWCYVDFHITARLREARHAARAQHEQRTDERFSNVHV
jgi:hypothetical protein